MNLLQQSRFETVSSLAFLFQVFKAVPQRWNTMFRREIQECRHWRQTELRSASQRDFILAIKFEGQQSSGLLGKILFLQVRDPQKLRGQFNTHGIHTSEL